MKVYINDRTYLASDILIVVDLEFSGLNPEKHSILSIGAVDFSNPERKFYRECRLRAGSTYEPRALKVNGFTVEQITNKKKDSPKRILVDFCKWAGEAEDHTLGGHSQNLDLIYLADGIKRYGIKFSFGHRGVDTHGVTYAHILSRGINPPVRNGKTDVNSDYVFRYVGIGKEPHPHNALTGAEMVAEALSRLIYGKPLLDAFKDKEVPKHLKS